MLKILKKLLNILKKIKNHFFPVQYLVSEIIYNNTQIYQIGNHNYTDVVINWGRLGFLDGIDYVYALAVLYENMTLILIKSRNINVSKDYETIIFPLIRSIFVKYTNVIIYLSLNDLKLLTYKIFDDTRCVFTTENASVDVLGEMAYNFVSKYTNDYLKSGRLNILEKVMENKFLKIRLNE